MFYILYEWCVHIVWFEKCSLCWWNLDSWFLVNFENRDWLDAWLVLLVKMLIELAFNVWVEICIVERMILELIMVRIDYSESFESCVIKMFFKDLLKIVWFCGEVDLSDICM